MRLIYALFLPATTTVIPASPIAANIATIIMVLPSPVFGETVEVLLQLPVEVAVLIVPAVLPSTTKATRERKLSTAVTVPLPTVHSTTSH